jgi:hypothetical protein
MTDAGRTMLDVLRDFERQIEEAPPQPWRIIARYDVPPGPPKRMWDTRGRLIWYIQRLYLDSLPRATQHTGIMPIADLGIPVYTEGPEFIQLGEE